MQGTIYSFAAAVGAHVITEDFPIFSKPFMTDCVKIAIGVAGSIGGAPAHTITRKSSVRI